MGCVSSNLLAQEDDLTQLGSAALSQHIVKLTSTTYGLLSLDPPPQPPQIPTTPPLPPPRFTLSEPEVIHWPDTTESFRFFPPQTPTNHHKQSHQKPKTHNHESRVLKPLNGNVSAPATTTTERKPTNECLPRNNKHHEPLCPPNGENKVVIYTTSLRGVRKTFEACNAVRSAVEGFHVAVSERDVSMDRGFREELRELMRGRERDETVPPRVFVKGKYIGGAEEVIRMVDEGQFGKLLEGLERKSLGGGVCDGCGDVRFLPCFRCNGSCKLVVLTDNINNNNVGKSNSNVVVRCSDCNENGLVLCPICS